MINFHIPLWEITQKAGDSVRKWSFLILLLVLTFCCACAAADTEYALSPCAGKLSLDESNYIVLTPDNLTEHPDLLAQINKSKEELLEDWTARGVQLQAWSKKMDICVEVTVIQDEGSRQYYDLEQQTRQIRNEYLRAHQGTGPLSVEGMKVFDLAWKKQKLGGNFLMFEYKRATALRSWRGLVRKTVRNGYTITLDYQVYADRKPRGTDKDNLNRIANTVSFEEIPPASVDAVPSGADAGTEDGTVSGPAAVSASGLLNVTVPPPAETNSETFTVEGTATPGGRIIGVVMRYSSSTPLKFTTTATRAGKFKLKITLPEEGVWLLTLNLDVNGVIVAEKVGFETTTFSRTLLPVVLDAEIPEELHSDELVISGKTSKAVTIQCIVTNGSTTFDKMVRTNGTGRFRFKVPTRDEGDYDITLAFSRKNFNSKRLTYTAKRTITAQDTQARDTAKAIHPSYAALTKKLDTYTGKTMVYSVYVTDVQKIEDEWIITAALRKNNKGYKDIMVFMADEDPGLEIGAKVRLYGKCVGAYQTQSEEENTTCPAFDYLSRE